MKELLTAIGYSLKDFCILPGYTHQNCDLRDVSLKSRLCRKGDGFIFLDLPFISAAMHAVTSVEIATALAELGGVGVIPLYKSIDEQCEKIKMVKQYKHKKRPHATIDAGEKLCVGAAISTHPEDKDRAAELIKAGTDFIVIDSSDGFSVYQRNMIERLKADYDTPLIGGNVVTCDAFMMLAEAGADAIKVGIGTGSGCTTSSVKAIGRGLATAIIEITKVRDEYNEKGKHIPIIADGGIKSPSDIAIALALGADTVMMGHYFAQFTESPGKMLEIKGKDVKEYWMEGSLRGYNLRRYAQSKDTFFEEGIDGFVPHIGSIYDHVPVSKKRLQGTLNATGASNMDDFHRFAVLEIQSPSALADGMVHDITNICN